MPDVVHVEGTGHCPRCSSPLVREVRCQWGILPGGRRMLGDSVEWLLDENGGVIPPFTLRNDPVRGWRWNCGDPEVRGVILFDVDVTGEYPARCDRCGTEVVASTVVVRNGKFQEIRLLTEVDRLEVLGDSVGKADIVVIRSDGSLWPREDWADHAVRYVKYPG